MRDWFWYALVLTVLGLPLAYALYILAITFLLGRPYQ